MILTVDIGNTTITLGGFTDDILQFIRRIDSDRTLTPAICAQQIAEQLTQQHITTAQIQGCVVASVVPILTPVVRQALEQLTGNSPCIVDKSTPCSVKIKGYDTSNLGTDRIVDCVAALKRWAPPLAVFDMGTATTLSVLDKDGCFCGGMILPGLQLSVDALSARAAQLPPITFEQPQKVIGTDTVSCMQYGALYGTAGSIEGIVQRVTEELGQAPTVVLTGGLSVHILPLLRCPVEYEPHLQLMGLYEIYREQQ